MPWPVGQTSPAEEASPRKRAFGTALARWISNKVHYENREPPEISPLFPIVGSCQGQAQRHGQQAIPSEPAKAGSIAKVVIVGRHFHRGRSSYSPELGVGDSEFGREHVASCCPRAPRRWNPARRHQVGRVMLPVSPCTITFLQRTDKPTRPSIRNRLSPLSGSRHNKCCHARRPPKQAFFSRDPQPPSSGTRPRCSAFSMKRCPR